MRGSRVKTFIFAIIFIGLAFAIINLLGSNFTDNEPPKISIKDISTLFRQYICGIFWYILVFPFQNLIMTSMAKEYRLLFRSSLQGYKQILHNSFLAALGTLFPYNMYRQLSHIAHQSLECFSHSMAYGASSIHPLHYHQCHNNDKISCNRLPMTPIPLSAYPAQVYCTPYPIYSDKLSLHLQNLPSHTWN